jgi:high-affinity K+ transport system ATPase subunit B
LKGVKYRAVGAASAAAPQPADLRPGRLVVPFIGIKLIDLAWPPPVWPEEDNP